MLTTTVCIHNEMSQEENHYLFSIFIGTLFIATILGHKLFKKMDIEI